MTDFAITVTCEDGQVRHDGTFATATEAQLFAEYGHACTAVHYYRSGAGRNTLADVTRAVWTRLVPVVAHPPSWQQARTAARIMLAQGLDTADAVSSMPAEMLLAYYTSAEKMLGIR